MSKKVNIKTGEITEVKSLATIFEEHPNLSLRKLAEATGVNYNMLLKAGKKPVAGQLYDPTLINYAEVEAYVRKKSETPMDSLNWEEIEAASAPVRTREAINWEIGDKLKIRQDDNVYQVFMTTETHIVIMALEGTQPRVFSWATFEHQGPKKYQVEEA